MKNTSLILNVVLFIGLGLLYFFHFSSTRSSKDDATTSLDTAQTVSDLKVAYVNIDSILLNYGLAKEMNNALVNKQSSMKSRMEKEMAEFEKDAQIFQDKVQKGIFLTQQRAEEAQQKLMMRQQELQQLESEYSNQLGSDQQRMNIQLFDSITNYIKEVNTPEKYQLVMAHSAASNILYGSAQLDITNQILKGLNSRYNAKK